MSDKAAAKWILDYQNAGCTVFQMEAPERPDYPGRTDLLAGFTVVPELWRRVERGEPVRCADLAKAGEIFCFVKLDGTEGLVDTAFDDREDIEDALDEALAEQGIGCVIGAGTGRRYSYVDLAVADYSKACGIIQHVLQKGQITKRSWLIPFDADKKYDSVGIWPDSPPLPDSL